mmetsp:Transcript_16521/g.39554  ORF Transcript_16521/g.39554 Transcript_16521/m.39554 type:complete len:82 (-) Transcript_16521:276-521(-)
MPRGPTAAYESPAAERALRRNALLLYADDACTSTSYFHPIEISVKVKKPAPPRAELPIAQQSRSYHLYTNCGQWQWTIQQQ